MVPVGNEAGRPFEVSDGAVLLREEPLAPLTSFRIGGPAELLLLPAESGDFSAGIEYAKREGKPWRLLGSGTNVLVPDAGLRGLTIKPWRRFSEISIDGTVITAQAGATMWEVSAKAAEAGLSGLEWACGIPGTVGGAVFMNAGVKEAEVKDVLAGALLLDKDGATSMWQPADLELGYRDSILLHGRPRRVLLEASFALRRSDPEEITARMNRCLESRRAAQPLEEPNCGSVFRNPPGDYAGRLIEAAGCKGLRRGGVKVSELHANFLVNTGGGLAADVLALAGEVRQRVYESSGIALDLEMRVLE
jgi:UDP-N-acetylmuramate dehydrogenase